MLEPVEGRVYPPPTPSLLTPWPANRPKTRKNSCFSSKFAQSTNPGGPPLSPDRSEPPKVRTLCSKWQRERPKSEPFAQNGSWNAKSTNPLREMAAGAPKVRTLCPKCQLERPRYHLRLKQFALTFGSLEIMHRRPFLEGSLGMCTPLYV